MGKVIDLNTGEVIAETNDPEAEFHVYINKVRKMSDTNHIRHGRCTRKDSRAFITQLTEEGIECVFDRLIKPDVVILAQGTAAEWDEEMAKG